MESIQTPIKDIQLARCSSGVHRLDMLRGNEWETVGYIMEDKVADVIRFMMFQIGAVKKNLHRGNIEQAKKELYID